MATSSWSLSERLAQERRSFIERVLAQPGLLQNIYRPALGESLKTLLPTGYQLLRELLDQIKNPDRNDDSSSIFGSNLEKNKRQVRFDDATLIDRSAHDTYLQITQADRLDRNVCLAQVSEPSDRSSQEPQLRVGTDLFTNEYLVAFILEAYLETMGRYQDNYLQYDAAARIRYSYKPWLFQPGREPYGLILREPSSLRLNQLGAIGDLERLVGSARAVVRSIVDQVLGILQLLQRDLAYEHGGLLIDQVYLSLNNTDQGFVCKLGDFQRASLTVTNRLGLAELAQPIHFYPYLWPLTLGGSTGWAFEPIIGHTNQVDGASYYQIPIREPVQSIGQARYLGRPYYRTFDTYTFMISLLLRPDLYNLVMNDPDLYERIWRPLWFEDDVITAQTRLRNSLDEIYQPDLNGSSTERTVAMATVVDVLRGLKLRCDATDRVLANNT